MRRFPLTLSMFFLLAALSVATSITAQDDEPTPESAPETAYFYTYHNLNGNRIADGVGTFPAVQALSIALPDAVLWLDSFADANYFGWRYLSEQATFPTGISFITPGLERFRAGFGGVAPSEYDSTLALMTPRYGEAGFPTTLPFADIYPLTHAVLLDEAGTYAYIATNGDLVLWRDGASVTRYPASAMLDARLTVSAGEQIAVYTQPTDRYAHAIMGNGVEAGALLVLSVDGDTLTESARVTLPESEVYEALIPLWADVDGDGADEIITTVSENTGGARIVVYRADGSLLAESPPVGRGFRWRHVIAAGNVGPDGAFEIVEVQTPHIGGIVQHWRYNAETGALEITAQLAGYTSHPIGSPNLDQAIVGDFDGDDTPELIVTTQARDRLVGLVRVPGGIREAWSIPLDAMPTSNFAAVTLPDGRLALAIGLADASLRVWLPEVEG